jgi:hypothetical protein
MKNTLAFVCLLSFLCTPLGSALADKGFSVKDVRGNYGFSFQGQIVGVGPVAAVGLITADGGGNITDAVRTISINGVPTTETFSCTITVNPDGTGSAVCPLDDPAPGAPPVETFDFVLEDKARAFRLVGTTFGIVVVGSGREQ